MIPNRIPLTREEVFDELMSGLNSSDPLESTLLRAARLSKGAGLVINELGEVIRSVGTAPTHLISQWVQGEAVTDADRARGAEPKSGTIGRWHVCAQAVRLRSRNHVIVIAVHDDETAETKNSAAGGLILDVMTKLLRAFEGFESFSISNRREESFRVLRDLEAGVSPGREPAIWRLLESFGFVAYEPIRAVRIRLDVSDTEAARTSLPPGGGLVIRETGNGTSSIEQTAVCSGDFDVESRLDAPGLLGAGVSGLFTSLSQVPEMLQTANVALESVSEPIFAFVDRMRPIEWAAARMSARFDRRLVAGFIAPIMTGPEASTTLRTYVDSGGSIAESAARLHVHENTVRYRLGQIEKALGARLTDPRIAAEVVLALQCLDTVE